MRIIVAGRRRWNRRRSAARESAAPDRRVGREGTPDAVVDRRVRPSASTNSLRSFARTRVDARERRQDVGAGFAGAPRVRRGRHYPVQLSPHLSTFESQVEAAGDSEFRRGGRQDDSRRRRDSAAVPRRRTRMRHRIRAAGAESRRGAFTPPNRKRAVSPRRGTPLESGGNRLATLVLVLVQTHATLGVVPIHDAEVRCERESRIALPCATRAPPNRQAPGRPVAAS
jgi:hypothetical protein